MNSLSRVVSNKLNNVFLNVRIPTGKKIEFLAVHNCDIIQQYGYKCYGPACIV